MSGVLDVSSADSLTWKNLIPCLSSVENCLTFCRKYGVLRDEERRDCVHCGGAKCVKHRKNSCDAEIPLQFHFRQCRKRTSTRKSTWFDSFKLSIQTTVMNFHMATTPTTSKVEASPLSFLKQEIVHMSVKQETPVEADPLAFPKQEIEYIPIKEETPEWDMPDDHYSIHDPLSITKEECSSSEDFLSSRALSIKEEEDRKYKDTMREDDFQELRHKVEPRSSGSEPERAIHVGAEDDKTNDDSGDLITCIPLASGTGDRLQCSTKQEASCGNKICARYVGRRCSICKTTFAQLQELKEHTHLNRHELTQSCSMCHKTFTKSSDLKRHIRVHSGERPYSCSVCNQTFARNSALKQHSRLHTGERPYSCGVCNSTFAHNDSLKHHLLLHTGERPYICDICNKSFIVKSKLRDHLRVHTGERPYICGICNKTFIVKRKLRDHMRVHTGQRPYICGVCNKTFIVKNNLMDHLRVHTGERPYTCGVCNKTFARNSAFYQHLRLHSSERPHRCVVCNKTFTRSSTLKQHSQLHTSERL